LTKKNPSCPYPYCLKEYDHKGKHTLSEQKIEKDIRFQVNIPIGNSLEIIQVEELQAERLGYNTFQLVETKNVRNDPQ
jgi:hypothetical protein